MEPLFSISTHAALARIKDFGNPDSLHEHRVASFGVTLIHEIFEKNTQDHNWVYTPEQRDGISNKIPDYTVEAVFPSLSETDLDPWLSMEFKKITGERTYSALKQLVDAVAPSLNENFPARYLVVIAGTKISYWEVDFKTHHRQNDHMLDHLWGCRSLFQSSLYQGDDDFTTKYPEANNINDLKPIYEDGIGGREPQTPEWLEAKNYHTNALLDITNYSHWIWIKKLTEHIATRRPAAFVDDTMER
jgi:hypothetical protein